MGLVRREVTRLASAIQFLTLLPVGWMSAKEEMSLSELRASVRWYPLVGALLGGCLYLVHGLLVLRTSDAVATMVGLTLAILLTGGIHVDGLMDTFDAIGSRRPREQALAIMRDSRIGAIGALVAMLFLLLQAFSAVQLGRLSPLLFVAVWSCSRWSLVLSMQFGPSARGREGLGALFAGQIRRRDLFGSGVICAVLVALTAPPLLAGAMLLWTVAVAWGLTRWFCRRFGGMTGDTYGATLLLTETTLYLFVLIWLGRGGVV
ncbi:MAG: adenosylcobinamide-GDP ribazoletransferase [Alicyclobacillaceae bacterium]|nr:adenosylcobinamide-GDP ribazoletransferase [Alicyclobacillaceae bacterium]